MSLQINILPLSADANLAVICEAAFQAVAYHPRNDKNPYNIYVLRTESGTQIEALLQSQYLSLDVGSSDLNDASLADALFKIAKDVPCAICSNDTEIVAVADPNFTKTAIATLECPIESVEPVTSGSDLFDLLFGVEPPRTSSPELASGLTDQGFLIDDADHQRATLRLQNGVVLQIDPDEHFGWQETEGVSLGFANPRFATVMSNWTPVISGPLAELDARTRRQDSVGFILWSGHLPFQTLPATVATPVLGVYEHAMPFDELVTRLIQTASAKVLAMEVFGGDLAPFVMPTEGLWVFLFLMAEAKCDRDEILDTYTNLKAEGAAFGSKKDLSLEIIDAYLHLHKNRLGARV